MKIEIRFSLELKERTNKIIHTRKSSQVFVYVYSYIFILFMKFVEHKTAIENQTACEITLRKN